MNVHHYKVVAGKYQINYTTWHFQIPKTFITTPHSIFKFQRLTFCCFMKLLYNRKKKPFYVLHPRTEWRKPNTASCINYLVSVSNLNGFWVQTEVLGANRSTKWDFFPFHDHAIHQAHHSCWTMLHINTPPYSKLTHSTLFHILNRPNCNSEQPNILNSKSLTQVFHGLQS